VGRQRSTYCFGPEIAVMADVWSSVVEVPARRGREKNGLDLRMVSLALTFDEPY
jgi:hypothetical protein